MMPYRILLYYKFTEISDYEKFAAEHLALCQSLGLLGRIIVAPEGINGTVSGTVEQTDIYQKTILSDPRFSDMVIKSDPSDKHAFRRLSVKARTEIVTLGPDNVNPVEKTGRYLEPPDFYAAMQEPDVVIIDARNDYEYDMGHFKGAIRPDVSNFKEFPAWVRQNLSSYRDKKVLTYCTGGIRCEKFTGLLINEGFKDVYQLHGGIVMYGKHPDTKGRDFEGKMYVFDERIGVEVNHTETASIITRCLYCEAVTDHFVNCAHLDCHKSFYICAACDRANQRSCSEACKNAEHHEYRVLGDALFEAPLTPRGLFKSILPTS